MGNISEQTLASYVQPLQTEAATWRPEFTGKVDEATRRRFGRGPTISPRKDRFDKVLDAVDGLFAGFANALTFGGSNYLRAAMWGQTATQNHQGIAYNIGMGAGVGVSFALGYGLGRGAAMGAWTAKGIRGYMITGDVVGVAQSSYNISTGQFTALDTLGFVPTVGWGMGALRRRYAGVRVGRGGRNEVHRVFEEGNPKFQLRPGEEGLSVFDANAVGPEDVLPHFREGSLLTTRQIAEIEKRNLQVLSTPGHESLPQHLIDAHMEIRPSVEMIQEAAAQGLSQKALRKRFKKALKELEDMQ